MPSRTVVESFDPSAIAAFGSIIDEIATERSAKGFPLTDDQRERMALNILNSASLGETDAKAMKALALASLGHPLDNR